MEQHAETEQNAQAQEKFRKNCLKEAGITYSVASIFPLVISFLIAAIAMAAVGAQYAETTWYRYLSYLVPQICFAVAAFLYFRRSKQPPKEVYCGCKWYYFLIAFLLQFGLLLLSEVNVYFLKLLELMGYEQSAMGMPDLTGWNLLPAILVIALLPAIFEETIFRGILSRNMFQNGWGVAATALISGALFALFHGNPAQTVYQFCCGACFTLIALRAGSVFPTMLSHFLNNAVILTMTSLGYEEFPSAVKLPLYLVCGVCLAGTLVYLIIFDKNNRQSGGVKHGKTFFIAAAAGIGMCAVEWLTVLVSGFIGG